MSNDLRTLELFAEANPVPDELAMETRDLEPAAYLATLQTRSSDVTQLDEKRQETEDSRPRWLVAVAAAAVVILIGVVTVLINQGGNETPPPATDPAPSTTLAAQGTDPTGYWVVDEVRQLALLEDGTYFWMTVGIVSDEGTWSSDGSVATFISGADSSACEEGASGQVRYSRTGSGELLVTFVADECSGERDIAPLNGSRTFSSTAAFERPQVEVDPWANIPTLEEGVDGPGRFRTGGPFQPAFALDIPDEWGFTLQSETFVSFVHLPRLAQETVLVVSSFAGFEGTQIESAIRDAEGVVATASVDATVGGAPGTTFQIEVADPGAVIGTFLLSEGFHTIWVLDVAGETVLIQARSATDTVLLEEAQPGFDSMIASIEWRDLTN